MRFAMPHNPFEFEIPDDWLAGILLDRRPAPAAGYASAGAFTLIPIADIQPPRRNLTVPKDWRGLDRGRFIRVLERMVSGHEIDPVPLRSVPPLDGSEQLYPFVVADGLHRFYASIVAGFDHLPAEIL